MRTSVGFLILLTVLLPASSSLAVVYVDQNAPGPTHDGTSWDTAFLTIQEGVDAATPDGEVWVADGSYIENIIMGEGVQLYGGFLGAEPSGYETSLDQRDYVANVATIDGHNAGSCVRMAPSAVVDGFTITNGTGTWASWAYGGGGVFCWCLDDDPEHSTFIRNNVIVSNSAWRGGGVYCWDSSPTITSNTFTGNRAFDPYGEETEGCGGGIYVAGGQPTIAHNTIISNVALVGGGLSCLDSSAIIAHNAIIDNSGKAAGGAIMCGLSASPTIAHNTIADNSAESGGSIYCFRCSPIIARNTFTGNCASEAGGAIGCRYYSSPTVTDNTFTGNSGGKGGAVYCYYSCSPTITNNTVTGNAATSTYGGAVYCGDESSPEVSNNIIAGNSARFGGAGVYCGSACSSAITNNTIWGNSARLSSGGGVCCDSSSSPKVSNNIIAGNSATVGGGIASSRADPLLSHNDVWGNTPDDYVGCGPGAGDISQDPLLVDPDNGDYHLTAASPCIDAGDDGAPGLPYQDFEGDPRCCDGDGDAVPVVDMGADEYREPYERNRAPGEWFIPGWVWFSIPLHPRWSADASDVLAFDCTNRLFGWDDALKIFLLYPDDFTDIDVGPSYVARLEVGEQYTPVYEGAQPDLPFERTLPAAGWCWVGVPSTQDIHGLNLSVTNNDETRSPSQDRDAPDPWLNWNWIFWLPDEQVYGIMNPFGAGDDEWLHPWYGYRVWSNTGDVTIIFP